MVGLSDIPCVGTALDRLSNAVVDAGYRGLRYMLCYKSLVNNLTSEIENVKLQEARVSTKIEEETNSGKTIQDHVIDWKAKVAEIKTLPEELSRQTPSWTCFNVVVFPNPVTRFRLGRKAAHKAKYAAELTASGVDLLKYEIADLPADPNMPVPDTMYQKFDSRDEAYDKLWEALVKLDGPPIIGIYGMPGVGKTRMMEKAWEHAKDEKIFNKVTRANVGNGTVDVIKLQNQIAGYLGCHFESPDNEGHRASQLKHSLNQAGKTLVILDDVWEEIHLGKIGIPHGNNIPKGCKILLTSRDENVCLRGGCLDPIQIHILTVDEAWDMFKNTVGTLKIDLLQDTSLAKLVCDECGRLPLLIHAVGNAIKAMTENTWKHTLSQLQDCKLDEVADIKPEVYACIRWSFDKLKNEPKRCLLLCSLFAEDAEIEIKMLGEIAMGSQLLSCRGNVEGVIDILKSSSLLLKGKTSRTVKLHDVIRDVARSIAAKDPEYEFLFISGGSCLPNNVNYRTRKLLQFVDSDNFRFPSGMVCPDLHTLWLENNNKPQQISKSFFEGILDLKILVLKGMPVFSERMPGQTFHNLSMLMLDGCTLNEKWLSSVPENLETLRVSRCGLPDPLDLSKLKYLRKLEVICDGEIEVVQNATSALPPTLVELHIPGGFRICDAEGKRILVPISSELNKLTALTSLNIWLEDSESCPDENIVANLLDFFVAVGVRLYFPYDLAKTRSVHLSGICIEGGGEALVERAEEVVLWEVKGLVKGFRSSNREAFTNLKSLFIRSCEEMEHVVEWKAQNEIQQSQQLSSFSNLTLLEIWNCRGLKYVFPASVGKCLVQLEYLSIRNCEAVEVVIRKERVIDDGMIINFPNLKHLTLNGLPSLRRFYGENRDDDDASSIPTASDCLFDGKVSFPRLELLELDVKDFKLDEIEVGLNNSITKFVVKCDNKVQLPSKWQLQFSNTEELSLYNCWCDGSFCIFNNRCKEGGGKYLVETSEQVMLEDVKGSRNGFSNSNSNKNREREPFSNMTELSIQSCEGIEHLACIPRSEIDQCRPLTCFSKITSLDIINCSGLKYLFSASVAKCLVELQRLVIQNCPTLEVVIRNESTVDGMIIKFPKLELLTLWNLDSFQRFYRDDRGRSSSSTTIIESAAISPDAYESPFDGMVSFPNVEILKFNVKSSSNFLSNSNIDSLTKLKRLFIGSCEDREALACIPQYKIQQSQPPTPFAELNKLCIYKCSGLKYLFCVSVAKCLVQLQELFINDCPTLEVVIQNESAINGVIIEFPKLKTLGLVKLQSLRRFYGEKRGKSSSSTAIMENAVSESLFNAMVAFPALKNLWIFNLKTSEIWRKNCYKDNSFGQLKSLAIVRCHNLEFAIPLAMLPKFQKLERLYIRKCDSMSEIIRKEENEDELMFLELIGLYLKDLPNFKSFCLYEFGHQFHLTTKVFFPKLLELEFYNVNTIILDEIELCKGDSTSELKKLDVRCHSEDQLPSKWQLQLSNIEELRLKNCIWHGSSGEHDVQQLFINPYETPSFQCLTVVEVRNCGLSALFSCSVFTNLHQLKKLKVKHCPLLEEVVREEENIVGTCENLITLEKLEYIELKHLPELKSFCRSASYAFNLPALKSIVLRKCPQMENFTFLEISTPSMPDFNSQMEKYLSNPNEGNEEDSSDSESDNNKGFDESYMGIWFDAKGVFL